MASVKGQTITRLDTKPVEYPPAAVVGGRIRVFFDSYQADGLEAGSTIAVARLPKGAVVYDIHVHHDDLGTDPGTLSVGTADAPALFLSAFATGSAGRQTMTGAHGAIAGVGHECPAVTDVMLTTADGPVTGTVKVAVFYALD